MIWPAAMNRELKKKFQTTRFGSVKMMAPKFSKTKISSSNPKKLGRRLGCNIQETLNIDNKSDRESDASVKSKHCRKRKRVSKPDREATAHKKRKDRSKKRRYDTDYSSSSENKSDVISLYSRNADEERSVISETVSRHFLVTPSQASTSSNSCLFVILLGTLLE